MIDDDKQVMVIDAEQVTIADIQAYHNPALNLIIAAWIDSKGNRSGSHRTRATYQDFIADFRSFLNERGCDLDSEARMVATLAQAWAGHSSKGKQIAPATFNQRKAVLSSFYAFAMKRGFLSTNPLTLVEGRTTQEYQSARPLDSEQVGNALSEIDRSTIAGARDYTLLSIALTTGRRANELVSLRIRHLEPSGETLIITWERTKGGKTIRDKIHTHLARVLIRYLEDFYGVPFASINPNAPVWVSLDNRNKGKELHHDGVAIICKKHLGTSKVHALRHTFAHTMSEAGAKPEEIQAKLQHTSLQTTGRYLAALNSAENKHTEKLAALLGIKE